MPNVIRIIKQKEPDKKRVVIYAFLTMVGSGRIADTAYTVSLLDSLQKFLQDVLSGGVSGSLGSTPSSGTTTTGILGTTTALGGSLGGSSSTGAESVSGDGTSWKLVDTYFDFVKARPQFARMIADCEIGRIDIILCRSLSEFAKTPLEAVNYIRKLGNLSIRLLFEAERIDTIDARSELLATILSMFPQHASSSSYGSLYGFQSGGPLSSYQGAALRLRPILQPLYGFRKNPVSCNYEIEPYEADVVRLIFNLYEHGLSVAQISDELLRRDILPPHFNRIGISAMKDTF